MVESLIRKLHIQTLFARIDLFQIEADTYARAFGDADSNEDKSRLARKWNETVGAKRAEELLLEAVLCDGGMSAQINSSNQAQ